MEILIFDTNGKFLKKVFIPLVEESADVLYPISICNDKLYQVVENPDSSQWEMHVHEIN
jgi:hypothetical protein